MDNKSGNHDPETDEKRIKGKRLNNFLPPSGESKIK
jgi:hypothetical protein